MNPRATILIPASKQKIPMKYGSVFSCRCRAEVLVRGGPCQSDAGRGTPGHPVHSDLSSPTGHQDICPCTGGERGDWRTRGGHRARKAQGTGCRDGRVRGHAQDQTASHGVDPRCWLCPEGGGLSMLAFVHIECLRGLILRQPGQNCSPTHLNFKPFVCSF